MSQSKKITHTIYIPHFFSQWRTDFLKKIETFDNTGLIRGIFLGEDSFISEDKKTIFRRTGLYHLLAASGFNCWIVSFYLGMTWGLFIRSITFLLPSPIYLIIKIWLSPVLYPLGAWLFWLWSDQSAPITRAAVLVSVKYILQIFHAQAQFFRLLFFQYLISLILSPKQFKNPSFQLTYGCLFGVIFMTEICRKILKKQNSLPRLIENTILSLSGSLGACLGALPSTWLFFGEICFTGVFTNFFISPLVTFILIPPSLIFMMMVPLPLSHLVSPPLCYLAEIAADLLLFSVTLADKFLPSLRYVD